MKIERRMVLQLAAFQPLHAQSTPALPPTFPAQPPELAREFVGVSHRDLKRVKELVSAHPSLAKASWDWGFGDWETGLGAASHVGNREIALYLIENGAPPTLFSAAMLGQLDVVKSLIAANPGYQRIPGPHSISLLAHAKAGGDSARAVYQYLESLGDAGGTPPVPLSEAESASLVGTYTFGSAANERIEIAIVRGFLQFTRTGASSIRLFHLGKLAFHPGGASAVRVRFDASGVLTVSDPDLVLSAKRLP